MLQVGILGYPQVLAEEALGVLAQQGRRRANDQAFAVQDDRAFGGRLLTNPVAASAG